MRSLWPSAKQCHEDTGGTVLSVAFPIQKQRCREGLFRPKPKGRYTGCKSTNKVAVIPQLYMTQVLQLPLFTVHSTRSTRATYLFLWGLNIVRPVDESLQVIATVPYLQNKNTLLMETMALVCPDTGDCFTASVFLGTNCIAGYCIVLSRSYLKEVRLFFLIKLISHLSFKSSVMFSIC